MRIEPLSPDDAAAVAELLNAPGDAEGRFFDGLPRDATALRDVFATAREDGYWGMTVDGRLAGVFMLRGRDAGYAAPAFGIVIANGFRGRGLGRLALQYCETWCRLRGTPELMLTVSADNHRAIALYESSGFVPSGERSAKGNPVYRKRLGK